MTINEPVRGHAAPLEQNFSDPSSVIASPPVLSDELRTLLVGRDVSAAHPAVKALVNDGILPTDESDCNEVAGWCLKENLPEHFALVPASELTISPPADLGMIVSCLPRAPALHMLRFEGFAIDTRAATSIAGSLQTMPSLVDLQFAFCDVAEGGLEELAQALKNPGLRSFTIEDIPIGNAMPALALVLRDSSLETLGLVRASIGNEELEVLCSALPRNLTLKDLLLCGNPFHDGSALGKMLRAASSLTSLSLWWTDFHAALPVLAALKDNACCLEHLSLRGTLLTFEDGIPGHNYLTDMLKGSRSLTTLDLRESPLTHQDLERLSAVLPCNFWLRELALHPHVSVSAEDIDRFIGSLKQNFRLAYVIMQYDGLSASQRGTIQAIVNRNKMEDHSLMHGLHGLHGLHGADMFAAKDLILDLLSERNHEGVSNVCRTLVATRATLSPEHMDELMHFAAQAPGQLAAFLRTLQWSGALFHVMKGALQAEWLDEKSCERIASWCKSCELYDERVPEAQMDQLADAAANVGRLDELLNALGRRGTESKPSASKLESLRARDANQPNPGT